MWKFIKRSLQVIGLLIIIGTGAGLSYRFSENFATDLAFLSCPAFDAKRLDMDSPNFFKTIQSKEFEKKPLLRLKKDWMRGEVILNWIALVGKSENGLQPAKRLKVSVTNYSGYDWTQKVRRTLNRETLVYTGNYGEEYWVKRQCSRINKQTFEKARRAIVLETKARQKI